MADLPHCLPLQPLPHRATQAEGVTLSPSSYRIDQQWRRINSLEFFKAGIEPKWEDPRNKNGGRFMFQCPHKQPDPQAIYEKLTFHFIGEAFENS
ncbi:unnamed protein product [Sphagnum balticum]